jgi:hypothetical protein
LGLLLGKYLLGGSEIAEEGGEDEAHGTV